MLRTTNRKIQDHPQEPRTVGTRRRLDTDEAVKCWKARWMHDPGILDVTAHGRRARNAHLKPTEHKEKDLQRFLACCVGGGRRDDRLTEVALVDQQEMCKQGGCVNTDTADCG